MKVDYRRGGPYNKLVNQIVFVVNFMPEGTGVGRRQRKEGMEVTAIGITATDTEMGKTVVTGALAAALRYRGIVPGIYKPVASGCIRKEGGTLISTDAEFQMKCAGYPEEKRREVIPVVLEAALAPAEASKLEGVPLDPEEMVRRARAVMASHEVTVFEGIGGITAPITDEFLVKDYFRALGVPVLIVVRPILGNVNHAVLTSFYCQRMGIPVLGFLVNGWEEATAGALERGNLYYYEKLTGLPVLGKLPRFTEAELEDPEAMAKLVEKHVELDRILALAGAAEGRH